MSTDPDKVLGLDRLYKVTIANRTKMRDAKETNLIVP